MFSILTFMNSASTIIVWIMLELNMVLFIMFFWKSFSLNYSNQHFFMQSFYYFLIQSLGSMLFIFSFAFGSIYYSSIFDMLLVMSIFLKMGIFPFSFWIYKLSLYVNKFILFLLLTIQKIPLFTLIFYIDSKFMYYLLILNMLYGSIMIMYSKSVSFLLVSSSIYSTILIFLFSMISMFSFLMFFLFYSLSINYILTTGLHNNNVSMMNDENDVMIIISILFILGLPPFMFFFYKISMINVLLSYFNLNSMMFMLWMATFISLVGYFNFFYKIFMSMKFLYKEAMFSLNLKNMMIMFMSMSMLCI